MRPLRGTPVDRLCDEGNSALDTPIDLRGKFFETLCPERAGCTLRRDRQ
jgi:hypothetical protein